MAGEERSCVAAPCLRPSDEEWADPFAYMLTLRATVEQYGVVRIVPPMHWYVCPNVFASLAQYVVSLSARAVWIRVCRPRVAHMSLRPPAYTPSFAPSHARFFSLVVRIRFN